MTSLANDLAFTLPPPLSKIPLSALEYTVLYTNYLHLIENSQYLLVDQNVDNILLQRTFKYCTI